MLCKWWWRKFLIFFTYILQKYVCKLDFTKKTANFKLFLAYKLLATRYTMPTTTTYRRRPEGGFRATTTTTTGTGRLVSRSSRNVARLPAGAKASSSG